MFWENDWVGFFLLYFRFCYYLCVTPWRFEWDERTKKFRLQGNPVQKILCILQYTLLGFWYLKDLRKIPVNSIDKNPVVYFTLAFNLNAIYYHCGVLASSYWRHERRYLALVNFDCEGYASSSVKKKLLAVFLCFLFAILPLMYSVYGYQIIPSSEMWDASLFLRCLVVEGRFAFFLNGTIRREPCNNNSPPEFSELCFIDFVVAFLAFLMEIARQIMGFYSDFFPLICCLSLWTSTGSIREFLDAQDDPDPTTTAAVMVVEPGLGLGSAELESASFQLRRVSFVDEGIRARDKCSNKDDATSINSNKRIFLPYITQTPSLDSTTASPPVSPSSASLFPVDQTKTQKIVEKKEIVEAGIVTGGGNFLLERYEICKAFSRTVNRALGQLLFAYVLSSIMYLSTCMDAVLVLQDWFGKLRVAFFFSIFILMFFVGSEIVNKVYGLRAWLSEPCNNAFISERNLLVLIHEVTCKSIGVCGNGMFTITYSTFMAVMTTTVTFFIIILQFQKPDKEDAIPVTLINMVLHNFTSLFENVTGAGLQPIMQ